MRLDRLEIEGLRGIPKGWPPVNIGVAGLVVYGPNGSGKSSIIDGIEFALNKPSSLYAENRMGVNWDKGSDHIGGGTKKAELFASLAGKEQSLSKLGGAPEEAKNWASFAAKSTFVLRRHMLLRFISAAPSDRYSNLEGFFNLERFTAIEAAISDLLNSSKSVESSLDLQARSQEQSLRNRLSLSETEQVSAEVIQSKLQATLEAVGLDGADTEEGRAKAKAQIEAELAGLAADSRLTQLAGLKSKVAELVVSSTFDLMLSQLGEFQNAVVEAQKESSAKAPAAFLLSAKKIIADSELQDCPVCEQAINPALTIASLDTRIANDAKTTAAITAWETHRGNVLRAIEHHVDAFRDMMSAWEKAFGEPLSGPYANEVSVLEHVVAALRSDGLVEKLGELRASLNVTLANHDGLISKLEAGLAADGGARRLALSNGLDVLQIASTDFQAYQSTRKHLQDEAKRRAGLERISVHALQARRATVQGIVDRLAALANEYYEFIHPGEGISKSKLDVRQVGKGSVEISTSFHGQDEHPLLHFSESHLDTLGLCYFLAARRLEAEAEPAFKLLVLDDVVHSVDADHRDRIARLLDNKFSDHQIVIVTHDSIFFQRLRAIFGSKFEYVYFVNWSLDQGPVRIQASTDIDRITSPELRNAMGQEELAASCGRFGEWLFMQLTERLQIAVQARFTRPHDIGTLWPPLAAKLRKHAPFAGKKQAVDDVDSSQWVRNKVGAHYNEPESPVTPAEVRSLAEGLNDLYDATFCTKCGRTIAKVSDKNWRCNCGALDYSTAEAATAP